MPFSGEPPGKQHELTMASRPILRPPDHDDDADVAACVAAPATTPTRRSPPQSNVSARST